MSSFGRISFVFAVAALLSAGAVAAVVEKTWFFTTTDSLTIDVQLARDARPNWADCVVVLARADGRGPARRLPLDRERVRAESEYGVQRVSLAALKVTAWTPTAPVLYHVALEVAGADGRRERIEQRIGFRSFSTRNGHLLLNGRPIFLRGLAINPPGRGIPQELERSRAFAEDYVRFMLRHNVNIIRIPDDETWYDVCDELGMMVFGGNYAGNALGREDRAVDETDARAPAKDRTAAARWYRERKFHPIAHHPSLMIYALTNETPYEGRLGEQWHAFLAEMYGHLRKWDPTRLYIANAGYGLGRTGDICDLHRYWGWYYSSPFTFLHLRDAPMVVFPEKVQPLTFTECVGNYSGPDGRVNLSPNHKNPISQQNWTGHAPQGEQAELGYAHQSFTFRQATELFRRLRPLNPELSGVFPFTILFHHWHTISAFDEMLPRPVTQQMRVSYQPVLLSWELHTPHVYAGAELKPICHVVNDASDFSDLREAMLRYELRDGSETAVASGSVALPEIPYYGTNRQPLALKIPAGVPTGTYRLHGEIVRAGRVITQNRVELFVASPGFARSGERPRQRVRLIDPTGRTQHAFARLGLEHDALRPGAGLGASLAPIVVGEVATSALGEKTSSALAEFARRGGRLLVLRQPHTEAAALNRLLPVKLRMPATDLDDPNYPPPPRPARQGMNINPERPDHPVFAGLDRRRLHTWSDYTGWDETKPGFPRIYPVTDTFVLQNKADVRTTAVLANHSVGLEGMALAEFFSGRGSIVLSGFDLAARAGLDPIADRLIVNLVSYLARNDEHEPHVFIDAPIVWGEYETERGVLTGITSGLMLNSRPALTGDYRDIKIVVHKDGHEFAGRAGGWNTRPGIQYVPYGRRPFGPYVHGGWSGTPKPDDAANPVGEGRFWCRIPAGKAQAVHRVFNPTAESLTLRIRANDREASTEIAPGATQVVSVPLARNTTTVETIIRGDRRLVFLETAFE